MDNTLKLVMESFAKFPKAKKLAVENFCFSAPTDRFANSSNLSQDARAYKWNSDTVKAIRYVLKAENKI